MSRLSSGDGGGGEMGENGREGGKINSGNFSSETSTTQIVFFFQALRTLKELASPGFSEGERGGRGGPEEQKN